MRDLITVIVAYDRAELLDIASVTSTFEIADLLGARRRYQLVLATDTTPSRYRSLQSRTAG